MSDYIVSLSMCMESAYLHEKPKQEAASDDIMWVRKTSSESIEKVDVQISEQKFDRRRGVLKNFYRVVK